MKRLTTRRPSDIIQCYDRVAQEWYEVTLPEGDYFALEMGLKLHVPFWGMNDDGMIDFAAGKEDGSWRGIPLDIDQSPSATTRASRRCWPNDMKGLTSSC